MKRLVKHLFIAVLILVTIAPASSQLCGKWNVTVKVLDGYSRPIREANVTFINVPADDAAHFREFHPTVSGGNILVATFTEGENVSSKAGRSIYEIFITAPDHKDIRSKVKIEYCRDSSSTFKLKSYHRRL